MCLVRGASRPKVDEENFIKPTEKLELKGKQIAHKLKARHKMLVILLRPGWAQDADAGFLLQDLSLQDREINTGYENYSKHTSSKKQERSVAMKNIKMIITPL